MKKVLWTMCCHADQKFWLVATEKGLCRIALPNEGREAIFQFLNQHFPSHTVQENGQDLFPYVQQLEQYLRGERRKWTVELDLWGTPFQVSVWKALQEIPYGMVWTYREVAAKIGRPKATRAVGTAIGRNPIPLVIPCHRVIGSDGTLTGFRGGLRLKDHLLHLEGIRGIKTAGHDCFTF